MKSNLSKDEFKKRLTELTTPGKDFYLITPYDFSGKPFCGTYDDAKFELTRNSFWRHPIAIQIKGEYKKSDNNSTEVIYELGWTKFMRSFFIVFNCIAFIGINVFIIANRNNFDPSLFSIILTINGLLVFANLWGLALNWVTKKM